MEKIKNFFKNKNFLFNEYFERLWVFSDEITIQFCRPTHENKKWILRVAPCIMFESWQNSTAIEAKFSTEEDVVKFLKTDMETIYKKCLRLLIRKLEKRC